MPEPTDQSLPASFHPLVSSWFARRYGEPTPVQAGAWPLIASGAHVLASAPTGSGKTLTAFLGALSRFATGDFPPAGLSVLYVSPLKALNEDVRLNLVAPARELSAWFAANGDGFPAIRVATRSGDTPQTERRSMLSSPPAILCTTPESLAILLASRSGLGFLSTTRLVILDEVHAVLGTKRGSMLACSVGRLALIAGEFQRVALSATVRPFEEAARFVGGSRLVRGPGGVASYEARPVATVSPPSCKRYDLSVAWPPAALPARTPTAGWDDRETEKPAGRYDAIVGDLAARIGNERSTIVFTDSRRRAERLAAMLNERSGEGMAWAHHGSLSKDVRKAVERRLREGRLKCVVATGTLELGIDVGAVDMVAVAGSPARADQLLQRAGRAGHGVGLTSRAIIYPFHGIDLLASAAAVGAALDFDIDPVRPPRAPLDVLAQVLLSMVLFEERGLGELFDEVRSFRPFEELPRSGFDAVVGLLAGRYSDSRVRELAPRVYLDAELGTMRARPGSAMLLYSSGGSIPDRGYYSMRLAGDGSKIGELDEEFVLERRVGNSFSFGSRAWRIVSIGDESVEVAPLDRDADFMPFWKAEKAPRGASVSWRMLAACSAYQADPGGFASRLVSGLGFSTEAAEALAAFLASQARAQGSAPLASASSVPVESFRDPGRKCDSQTLIIHTLRGTSVNEPLGLALATELGQALGLHVDRLSDDDSVSLALPLADRSEAEAALKAALAALADPARLGAAIRSGLAESAAFGAAFRENAGRALLLPRSGFGKRTPLWVTRLKAKRLYEKTLAYDDFPVVEETWKNVLEARFDLRALSELCAGLGDGSVSLAFFSPSAPSPFARQSGWAETNRYLYEGDGMPGAGGGTIPGPRSAGDAAIEAALVDASARPRLAADFAVEFGRKVRRELPGWAPESDDALAGWVDERLAIPLDEWATLLAACPPELARAAGAAISRSVDSGSEAGLLERLVVTRLPGASVEVVLRRERLAALKAADNAERRLGAAVEWLGSTGPEPLSRLRSIFGLDPDDGRLSETLAASGAVVCGDMGTMGGAAGIAGVCDRDRLESMLRRARKAARPAVRTLPASSLAAFIASRQGLRDYARPDLERSGVEATRLALRTLSGCPAPAALWETEILPARVAGYRPEFLDEVLAAGEFVWFGAGKETVAFAAADDFEAFSPGIASGILKPGEAPVDAWTIKDRMGLSITGLEDALWGEIWSGAIGSDSFAAIRHAAAMGYARFAAREAAGSSPEAGHESAGKARGRTQRVPMALRGRWKAGAPLEGLWFSLAVDEGGRRDEADVLEGMTTAARAIVRRYGLACKALVEKEARWIRWSDLFPAIRRLELAGELVWGRFFDGLEGLQFMDTAAFPAFREGGFDEALVSMNACDPASPAGLAMTGLDERVPSRLPVNRMSMRGGSPVCVSKRSWRDMEIALAPDESALGRSLAFLVEARRRAVAPERRIPVASINGEPAASSPYAPAFAALGFDSDRGSLTLW